MKVYTFDCEAACVVERECEVFGYPNLDSAGSTMYENTHFRTPLEAWETLVRECEAAVSLDASDRDNARQRLERATHRLADSAEKLVRAKRNKPEDP